VTTVGVVAHAGKTFGGGLDALRTALADAGFADPPWYEVDKSRKAPKKVRKLVSDGVDRLLVWGGDGTVRRCIDTLVHDGLDGVTLGVLPAGTANLLASNLGIPNDLVQAVDVALHGEPTSLDVGEMNGACFAVMAGTGFDALMIKDADESGLKDRFGRLGYVWSTVRHTRTRPATATVELDGELWFHGPATSILVANVGNVIGGIKMFPQASPTDGRLDVGVTRARTRLQWVRVFARAVVRRASLSPLVEVSTAAKVTVRLDRPLAWQVDGGYQEDADGYKVRCRAGAVTICRPRDAASG
jgi:YegS/Rv2252/BmrU family lipid kinase